MRKILLLISIVCNCLLLSAKEYTYLPTQTSDLKELLKGQLQPGDVVYLSDGVYNDLQIDFKGEGTSSAPITLKAKNRGKVILTGSIGIQMSGNYLTIDGLVLKNGMAAKNDIVAFRTSTNELAYNCRLTNTVIDNCNNPDPKFTSSTSYSERWVMLYGKNNRVDHCYFTNKINGGVIMMVSLNEENSRDNNHIIDYNLFSHRPKFDPGNNAEIIRLGDSNTSQYTSRTIVENNYFLACDGEAEVISVKSCDNILRGNVFYESAGALVCRHGHRNVIETNAFIGNNKDKTGGIRVINEGHRIYNNFFQDLVGTGSYSALCVMMAMFEKPTTSTDTDKEPLNAYHRVKDVEICHNTFVNCENIDLGKETTYTYPDSNPYFPKEKIAGTLPPECLIANNIIYNPSSKKNINQVSGNVALISYSNNIYTLKSNPHINGFEAREINFIKPETDYGKGIYLMTNASNQLLSPYNSSGYVFDYVKHDISGQTRISPKCIGAQQAVNVKRAFAIGKIAEVGTRWYEAEIEDKQYIEKTTDFWTDDHNSIVSQQQESDTYEVKKTGKKQFEISSVLLIQSVSVLDTRGQIMLRQAVNNYSTTIDCDRMTSGSYLFCIDTFARGSFCKKIRV